MVIIYTNYDGLVDATCQVTCKSPNRSSGSGKYFERFITYMGMAAIVAMCQHHAIIFYFPRMKKLAYKIWLKMVHSFLRKASFNFHV